jgi:hypothetical protein
MSGETNWLGVVSRDHVLRGVEKGIAQIGHGKSAGLQRMGAGDGFVYYSPRDAYPNGAPVQASRRSAGSPTTRSGRPTKATSNRGGVASTTSATRPRFRSRT